MSTVVDPTVLLRSSSRGEMLAPGHRCSAVTLMSASGPPL